MPVIPGAGKIVKESEKKGVKAMDKVILILLGCAAAIVRELAEDE